MVHKNPVSGPGDGVSLLNILMLFRKRLIFSFLFADRLFQEHP